MVSPHFPNLYLRGVPPVPRLAGLDIGRSIVLYLSGEQRHGKDEGYGSQGPELIEQSIEHQLQRFGQIICSAPPEPRKDLVVADVRGRHAQWRRRDGVEPEGLAIDHLAGL